VHVVAGHKTILTLDEFGQEARNILSVKILTVAGYSSLSWHPLLSDFILLGQKLEQLGFTYYKGKVTVVDPAEVQ